MHGFRDNDVFLLTGYDVIVICPPGVNSRYFIWRILKGWPRLYIRVQFTLFVYLERFRRYSIFLFGWDFFTTTWGEIVGIWGQNDPQNVNGEKTLAGRTLSYAKLRLLSHCAWNHLNPFDLCRCARKKGRKDSRKEGRKEEKSQEVYISRLRGATFGERILTKLG